jgi:hypothetical protein
MTAPPDEKKYPYSRNRVIINVAIAASSLILALFLLSSDVISLLLYLMSTSVFVIVTLLLKGFLYPKVIAADSGQDDSSASDKPTPFWRTALPAFLLLLGFVAAPLLLAGFVPGIIWFITMIGFTTGIGISEILFYVQSRSVNSSQEN